MVLSDHLSDFDIKKEAARGLGSSTRSFYSIYSLAEEARRTNIEVTNLADAETKEKQLQYYKGLAEKNTSIVETRPNRNNPEPQFSNPSFERQPNAPSRSYKSGNSRYSYDNQALVSNNNNRQPILPYELPTNFPDRSTSRNPFINKTRTWTKELGALCVCCGKCGHTSKQCTDGYLPAWERAYLEEIVFGDPPQASFVQLGGGEQDQSATPFGCHHTPAPHQSSIPYTTAHSNSVSVRCDGEPRLASEFSSMSVNAFYGESSGPNKRPYLENDSWAEQTNNPQQERADRPKRKGQKWVGKKAEATPLAGLIDEISGAFEKPTAVREVLKRNRVDISFMDWMAWSPSAFKELKRLCTRVSKKRQTKLKSPSTVTHEIPNAFSMASPNFSSPSHPSIPGFPSQVPIPQQAKSTSSTLPIPQF